jgi:hypothetical protein
MMDARDGEGAREYRCDDGMSVWSLSNSLWFAGGFGRDLRLPLAEVPVEDSKSALTQLFCLRNLAGRVIDWG